MRSKIKKIYQYSLSPPGISLAGGMAANFFGYLYQAGSGKLLPPTEYGVLLALISLVNLVSIPAFAFNASLAKVVTEIFVSRDQRKLKVYAVYFLKLSLFIVLLTSLAGYGLKGALAGLLHIQDTNLIFLTGLLTGINYVLFVIFAVQRGVLKLSVFGATNAVNGLTRVIFGVGLIYLGFGVWGGLGGFLISTVLTVLLGAWYLRDVLRIGGNKGKGGDGGDIDKRLSQTWKLSAPVLLGTIAVYSFWNTDILLVKRFFTATEAGLYSAASVLGRVIFFGTLVIISTAYPLIVEKFSRGESYKKVALFYLGLTALFSLGVTAFFALFPSFLVKSMFQSGYAGAGAILVPFGIFMTLISLNNFFVNFFWAVSRARQSALLAGGAVLQVAGISWFHQSLSQVVWVSIISLSLVFAAYMLYFIRLRRKSTGPSFAKAFTFAKASVDRSEG